MLGCVRRGLAVLVVSGVFAALASQASACVRVVKFTSRVNANETASLTVKVSPAAWCRITVTYDTVVSHAKGLGPKRGGEITWTWKVGSRTRPGKWPVVVDCGKGGKLRRFLGVLAQA